MPSSKNRRKPKKKTPKKSTVASKQESRSKSSHGSRSKSNSSNTIKNKAATKIQSKFKKYRTRKQEIKSYLDARLEESRNKKREEREKKNLDKSFRSTQRLSRQLDRQKYLESMQINDVTPKYIELIDSINTIFTDNKYGKYEIKTAKYSTNKDLISLDLYFPRSSLLFQDIHITILKNGEKNGIHITFDLKFDTKQQKKQLYSEYVGVELDNTRDGRFGLHENQLVYNYRSIEGKKQRPVPLANGYRDIIDFFSNSIIRNLKPRIKITDIMQLFIILKLLKENYNTKIKPTIIRANNSTTSNSTTSNK